MKLSEILGWEKKRSENQEMVGVTNASLNSVVNTALTSCDREIDREALANVIIRWIGYNPELSVEERKNLADAIISTMPTWLKSINREQ